MVENSRLRAQGGHHIAKNASEGKEEDEGAGNEGSQDEADEHGWRGGQKGSVCQHRVKKRIAQDALHIVVQSSTVQKQFSLY